MANDMIIIPVFSVTGGVSFCLCFFALARAMAAATTAFWRHRINCFGGLLHVCNRNNRRLSLCILAFLLWQSRSRHGCFSGCFWSADAAGSCSAFIAELSDVLPTNSAFRAFCSSPVPQRQPLYEHRRWLCNCWVEVFPLAACCAFSA